MNLTHWEAAYSSQTASSTSDTTSTACQTRLTTPVEPFGPAPSSSVVPQLPERRRGACSLSSPTQLSTTTSTSKAERSSATSTPASPATPLTSSSGSRSDTHRSSSQLYLERRRPNRATSSVPTTQPIPPGIARSCAQQLEAILPTLCRTGGAHAPRQPPPGARLSRSHLRVCPLVWSRHGNPVPTDYPNSDGQPTDVASRRYPLVRGLGDGRSMPATILEHAEEPKLHTPAKAPATP